VHYRVDFTDGAAPETGAITGKALSLDQAAGLARAAVKTKLRGEHYRVECITICSVCGPI